MSSIDERVVNMKFNNAQFLSGVSQTMTSLSQLKTGLKLDGATKGLENVDAATKKIDLKKIADGVEQLTGKFSAMSLIGVGALTSLGSKALDTGLEFVKSLSGFDAMKEGFQSYQDQINATQTILANVEMHGHDLKDVTNVLDELQKYAQQTVYNFGDMTKNISLFTAAGVDLNDSVASIKGFSNFAASAGVDAEHTSAAMFQLSQALASGSVKLQDWNSLQQNGLSGVDFQNALKRTAEVHGQNVDAMIKKEGSFRDSLKDGWLTTQVLTETLNQYTGDLTDEQLKSMGYSEQQIADIQKVAKTALESATNIRTVGQMMSALHEEVAGSWAKVFKVILGDLPAATTLFTAMHNTLENLFTGGVNNLAETLKGWDALGGRTILFQGLLNIWNALVPIAQALEEAFKMVFPPTTAQQLKEITDRFTAFTAKLTPSLGTIVQFRTIFKAFFDILDLGKLVITEVFTQLGRVLGSMHGAGKGALGYADDLAVLIIKFHDAVVNGTLVWHVFKTIGDVGIFLVGIVKDIGRVLDVVWDGIKTMKLDGFNVGLQTMGRHFKTLADVGPPLEHFFSWLPGALQKVSKFFGPIGQAIGEQFGHLGDTIANAIRTANFSQIGDALNTGIFALIALSIRKFMKGGIQIDAGGFLKSIKEPFEQLSGVLQGMQQNLKADVLIKIAAAVGILTASVAILSLIDSARLTASITALGFMFGELLSAQAILNKIADSPGTVKSAAIAGSLLAMAFAIDLLAIAVEKLSKLSWEQIAKGLTSVIGLMLGMSGAIKLMSGSEGKLVSAGIAMIGIAIAIDMLAKAVKKFGDMKTEELIKGIGSVTLLMAVLSTFATVTDPSTSMIKLAGAMVILAFAMDVMYKAVKDFSSLNWEQLGRGMAGVGGAMLILSLGMRLMQGTISGAAALVIAAEALKILQPVVKAMGDMPWDNIGRGMTVLGGSMAILAVGLSLMDGALPGAAALLVAAGALYVIQPVLKAFGDMPWDNIGRAMVVLGGSMAILALSMALMEGALPGALALIVAAGALAILTPVLQTLGNMSWDQIGTGLGALAAVLGLLAVAGILILPAIPGLILLGVAVTLLGVGTLLAGAGLLMFSAGLTALAVAGAAGTAALVAMVTALLGLIPLAFQKIGEGIVAFAKVIGDSAPQFIDAMVKLMVALLTAINTVAPLVVQTLMNLLWLLINTIRANLPGFIQAGFDILVGFLNGIGNNIGRVVDAAVNIIVNFINGIANELWRIIDAGTNLIIQFIEGISNAGVRITNAAADAIVKFVNGVAEAIRTHSGDLRSAGGNLAGAIIDGMTGGLGSRVTDVWNAAVNIGNKAIEAIKAAVDSHSPSKKAHQIGLWTSEGFANGITELSDHVENAASGVGETALGALQNTISGIGSKVALTMDTQPVIRPVLDLTQVKRDAATVGGLFAPPKLTVADSYNKASYISAATAETQGLTPSGNTGVSAAGQSVVFTQNNYSPVALSATEIYRQTNNQLSILQKGVTVDAATS